MVENQMFDSLLVANRGEIAVRVLQTCRRLGIRGVAVYTDADAGAPHVQMADAAVRIASYLDVDAVVAAALSATVVAIHPGYGFLSEQAGFAAAVSRAGLVFVGPPAEVMEQMGRKDAAREIAQHAGVPVIPSYAIDSPPGKMSFPVLVKAAAGGGGKGMRIVGSAATLTSSIASARREARSAFGDDTLLIETFVERGRHIEVQILADMGGQVLHLHERDCSVQRRHQKVIEEAPAPTLAEHLRSAITEAAVDLAREVGYVNAGTVEFLLDPRTQEFFFLEMNTRLQVEHPVTEAICGGLDLVEWQLRIASGERLALGQDEIVRDGHAIEARIYAEDPYQEFLPQAGTATMVRWPDGAGVRVDEALRSGQTVSTAYDPMLAKIIVHGRDREAARRALVAALDDSVVLGLTTNTGFVRALVASEEFADAAIDTGWLDRTTIAPPDSKSAQTIAAEALAGLAVETAGNGPFRADGWRLAAPAAPLQVELDDTVLTVSTPPRPALDAVVEVTAHQVEVVRHGQRFVFARPDLFVDHAVAAGDGVITAPMPSVVIEVTVDVGDLVESGQVLGSLEAMKMELMVRAPFAGRVTAVTATPGAQVTHGHHLFTVEPVD
ncbi:MAG: carbamoyl-phosphate synthase subunit L [Microlunatus sp.]|nr:carbamoyl-phosphate synthase subunit L [Microlunatus sp.]MDN5771580.1 carbamoyl-phosphate synthase subunit L [Microlunatus sp.]